MSDTKAGYYESPSKTFSPGSQDGSNKKRNQPLLPVSIRQLHNAQQVTPDADDFTLNNQPLSVVCLIGQIVATQPTQTHLNYAVDDSTGTIDVRSWVDQENPQKNQQQWGAGDYVRVIGNLRSFGEKRYVVASAQLLPIDDFNEVTHHFLEIIHLNLTLSGRRSKGTSNSMDVTPNSYYKTPVSNTINNNNNNSLNDLQGQIIRLVQENDKQGEGLNIDEIVRNFSQLYDENSVRIQINFLIDEGHLYNTTDENHVGATDEI
jgi:replication factor A2